MLAYQSVMGVLVPIQRMICRMFRKYGKETPQKAWFVRDGTMYVGP